MPNIVNRMVTRELEAAFEGVDGMILVSFGGLSVAETEKLRTEVAEKGARLKMVRNSLARRVLAERGLEFEGSALEGNTAIAYGDTEAIIGAAKVLTDKAVKKAGKVTLKAGVMEGQTLDSAGANSLADLPDRNTVNAMLLGVISAPARQLACVLNAVPSATVRVINARVEKEGGAEG